MDRYADENDLEILLTPLARPYVTVLDVPPGCVAVDHTMGAGSSDGARESARRGPCE